MVKVHIRSHLDECAAVYWAVARLHTERGFCQGAQKLNVALNVHSRCDWAARHGYDECVSPRPKEPLASRCQQARPMGEPATLMWWHVDDLSIQLHVNQVVISSECQIKPRAARLTDLEIRAERESSR